MQTPSDTLFDQIQKGSLTKEEFDALLLNYGYEWPLRRKLLWAMLATRRVVFIGFSMKDPYFLKMLDYVSNDLNPFGFDTHFLILRITKENKISAFQFAERLKDQYGIETVFFEDDENFKGLENFILEMGNKMLPKSIYRKDDVTQPATETSTNKEVTDELFLLIEKQIFNDNKQG